MDWNFVRGKYTDESPEGFEEFSNELPMIVEGVYCKGKFIYFVLFNDNGYFYIMHSLRMTGRWQKMSDNHCTCYIESDEKEPLWFRNPRGLATFEFTRDKERLDDYINGLGPDILDPSQFTLPVWKQIVADNKRKNITTLMMNQNIVAGIGNYQKAESLYHAGVSPLRKTESLTEDEIKRLYQGIVLVSRSSYNYGGMSIQDYANENCQKGSYGSQLKIYAKKYARTTKTPDGRTTYWDPSVQK
jgi:formamidopyrimidine-DNA glycosylase